MSNTSKKRVVSGIRPTGELHLGNYFGAIRNFVYMQDKYDCFFFIADWHALTTHPKPEDLPNNIRRALITYIASGVDPHKATLYIQSHIPEIAELYLYLNMIAYLGELERCPTFKEKVRQQPDNVNAGLLTYPVLMAADILIHRAHYVPVGKDQLPHLELARDYARRFNHIYATDLFPEPQPYDFSGSLVKVPGLDGSPKMSKTGSSEKGVIYLSDPPEVIRKKVMRAVTDSGPQPGKPMSEPVKNLFTLLELVSKPDTVTYFKEQYDRGTIKYVELKQQLAEDIINLLKPIQEKMKELESNPSQIKEIIELGAEKARTSAKATLSRVRELICIGKV